MLQQGDKVTFHFSGQKRIHWNLPENNQVVEIKGECPIEGKNYYTLVGYETDHCGDAQSFNSTTLQKINKNQKQNGEKTTIELSREA